MTAASPTQFRDRSPVSLTGHYTGQVWVRHGLAPAAFSSRTGRWAYRAISPADRISRRWPGYSLELMLLQRHALIDALLWEARRRAPDLQVLELACGLSARALRLLNEPASAAVTYWEADLPRMAGLKMRLLAASGLEDPRHRVVPCNILRTEGLLSIEAIAAELDTRRPLVVISEGLTPYFGRSTIEPFWRRLALLMKRFPEAEYLADHWPRLPEHGGLALRAAALRGLELLVRQPISLHFEDDRAIELAFRDYGFADVEVRNPDADSTLPRSRKPALFRVVRAVQRR